MQLGYLRLDWQSIAIALGAGIAAVVVLESLRRMLGWILGPIFVYETTRLARKRHTFWLRCLFALAVLALLSVSVPNVREFTIPPADVREELAETPIQLNNPYLEQRLGGPYVMQQFAEEFSKTFLLIVSAMTMLITPFYLGSAISEEKEKRSIDFLLATHVTNFEFVIGKLAARLLNLFGIILVGLPILAITQVWGGVDLRQLVDGLTAIFIAVLGYASISIWCSALFRRTRDAIIAAYIVILGLNLVVAAAGFSQFFSPIGYVLVLRRFSDDSLANDIKLVQITIYIASNLALTIMTLPLSVLLVRWLALRAAARRRRVLTPRSPVDPKPSILPVHPMTVKDNPPIEGDPLAWKERYLGRTFGGWALNSTYWIYLYMIFGIFGIGALMIALNGWQELFHKTVVTEILRVALVAMAAVVVFAVGLRMTAAISREREHLTLVSLLTLPVEPVAILRAKWLGTLQRSSRAVFGLAILVVIVGLWGGMPWPSWFLLPFSLISYIWFVGNLGLLLSVICPSTNRAMSILIAIILSVMAGAWTMSYFAERSHERRTREAALAAEQRGSDLLRPGPASLIEEYSNLSWIEDYLNPVRVWWRLSAYSYRDQDYGSDEKTNPLLLILATWAVVAVGCALFGLAWLGFRKEGSRG